MKMGKSEYQKEWRKKNPERFKLCKLKWNKEHKEDCKKYRQKHYQKYKKKIRELDRVRLQTWRKYSPLKKGFQYHHFEPYSVDNFIILETGIHKFLHNHQKRKEMIAK